MSHERDERRRERHREHELAQREVPGLLEHLLVDLEAVAEQDQDQRHDARPWTKPEVGSNSSTSVPPSPRANPAITNTAASETKLRPASPEMSAPSHEQHAEHRERRLQELDPCCDRRTRELCQTIPARTGYGGPRHAACRCHHDGPAGAGDPAGRDAPRARLPRSGRSRAAGSSAWSPPRRPLPSPRRPRRRLLRARRPPRPPSPAGRAAQAPGDWQRARVPSVFDARALPSLFPGTVRRYRVTFRGPPTPRGFSWLLRFESVRRNTAVILNGRRIGRNVDPYTPFTVPARGLRPGRPNELVVIVDGRKNPKLPEAWWNWNGIVRPVTLVPGRARAHRRPRHDVEAALPRPGTRLPRRAADRRPARAPRRAPDQARARGAAPLARRAHHAPRVPAAGAAREAAPAPALDARPRARAVVARRAAALLRRAHAPRPRARGAARHAAASAFAPSR